MKFLALALVAGMATAVAAPAFAQTTGSMAYPAPVPQGNLSSTTTGGNSVGSATGSMAYPQPQPQGNVGATQAPPARTDTGSMAYPAPLPQGNLSTTTTPAK